MVQVTAATGPSAYTPSAVRRKFSEWRAARNSPSIAQTSTSAINTAREAEISHTVSDARASTGHLDFALDTLLPHTEEARALAHLEAHQKFDGIFPHYLNHFRDLEVRQALYRISTPSETFNLVGRKLVSNGYESAALRVPYEALGA